MPSKTKAGRRYEVDGKRFTWTTEDGDQVVIPLRLKVKTVRALSGHDLDVDGMFAMLEALVPDQVDVVDEMDVNDLQAMFAAWQGEYQALSGATLGEASGSSS